MPSPGDLLNPGIKPESSTLQTEDYLVPNPGYTHWNWVLQKWVSGKDKLVNCWQVNEGWWARRHWGRGRKKRQEAETLLGGRRSRLTGAGAGKVTRALTRKAVIFFLIYFILFYFIFISWRLITLQYCSGFCHTFTRISHGFTCIPHPDPPYHLPLHPIPLGLPSAPALSTCLMHPTWAGDLFHPR